MIGDLTIGLFCFVVVVSVGFIFLFPFYFINYKDCRSRLSNIEACLRLIEMNPNFSEAYDRIIKTWKSYICWNYSDLMTIKILLKSDCYDRLLHICDSNSANPQVWILLKEIVKPISKIFNTNKYGKQARTNTFILLSNCIFKEFENQPITEEIISLLYLMQGIRRSETQELYDKALELLKNNPNNLEAKRLAAIVGKYHYSMHRWNKKPSKSETRAIQENISMLSTR